MAYVFIFPSFYSLSTLLTLFSGDPRLASPGAVSRSMGSAPDRSSHKGRPVFGITDIQSAVDRSKCSAQCSSWGFSRQVVACSRRPGCLGHGNQRCTKQSPACGVCSVNRIRQHEIRPPPAFKTATPEARQAPSSRAEVWPRPLSRSPCAFSRFFQSALVYERQAFLRRSCQLADEKATRILWAALQTILREKRWAAEAS